MKILSQKSFEQWNNERYDSVVGPCYGQLPRLAKDLLKVVSEKDTTQIKGLDFGCGDGLLTINFLPYFSLFHVIAQGKSALVCTQKRANSVIDCIKRQSRGNSNAIPTLVYHEHNFNEINDTEFRQLIEKNNEQFDMVLSGDLIQYLSPESTKFFFQNVRTFLKEGGVFYLSYESDIHMSLSYGESFTISNMFNYSMEDLLKNEVLDTSFLCIKHTSNNIYRTFSLPNCACLELEIPETEKIYIRSYKLNELVFVKKPIKSSIFFTPRKYVFDKLYDIYYQQYNNDIYNVAQNISAKGDKINPIKICELLYNGWNQVIATKQNMGLIDNSETEKLFSAIHLWYYDGQKSELTEYGENRCILSFFLCKILFPKISFVELLFAKNPHFSRISFSIENKKRNRFLKNHISLVSYLFESDLYPAELIAWINQIKIFNNTNINDSDRKNLVNSLCSIFEKNKNWVNNFVSNWLKSLAEEQSFYDYIESAIDEYLSNNPDFWGYKSQTGNYVKTSIPIGISHIDSWIMVLVIKMLVYSPGEFVIMEVDGLASDNNFSKTASMLTCNIPIDIDDKSRTAYHNLFWFANYNALQIIRNYQIGLLDSHKQKTAIRTAIGSIMSRNGSHNIGSHVLAALSHNVGTMPDDRVLFQYIQHRMDYIATATTDFPTWRQPTMFLGTMMKTFLSQRHLLDHIAGSEGLRAWKFQDRYNSDGRPATDNVNNEKSKWCIKFHIYPNEKDKYRGFTRKRKNGRIVECINYNTGCMDNINEDVSLAIPGGTVGQHAFFTIIENVIRNAAKHDWSSPPESIDTESNDGNKKKVKASNLEINIDFADLPEEGNVLFRISTNLSDAKEKEGQSEETLIERIGKKLSAKFIDFSGALRRENWGIAEMKISAGYLQGREIGVIGGIESDCEKAEIDKERFGNIITAVEVEGGHLGYEFRVPKARTLLLVTDKEMSITADKVKYLAGFGVYVKAKKNVMDANSDNSFEFVLVYNAQKEIEEWLPSRIVDAWQPVENIVASLVNDENLPKTVCDRVAAEYVKQLWREEKTLNLVVAPFQGGRGGGQSLVDEAAATAFVFENGFQEAVDSFMELSAPAYEDIVKEGITQKIKRLCSSISRLVLSRVNDDEETENALNFFLEKALSEGISNELKQSCHNGYIDLIKLQLKAWLNDSTAPNFPSIRDFINGVTSHGPDKFEQFCAYFAKVCTQAKGYLGLYAEQIATLPKGFEQSSVANGLFSKRCWNEARIVIDKNDNPANARTSANEPAIGFLRHEKVCADEKNISTFVDNPFVSTPKFRYLEPLSGSQSYLVQLQALTQDDRILQAKLIECALTRILIVDERVSKFAATHSADIRATFALMGIRIADDKAADDELNGLEVNEKVAGLFQLPVKEIKVLRTDIENAQDLTSLRTRMQSRTHIYDKFRKIFDVLIIHQGILDKWFHNLVDDKVKMPLLLEALQEIFKKVIITTGRGTPTNIPDKARVLPFSTIETTLFKMYPEKLILVDAIMNILPVHRNASN